MLGIIGLGGIYKDAYQESLSFIKNGDVILYDSDSRATAEAMEFAKKQGLNYKTATSLINVFENADSVCLFVPPKAILPIIEEVVQNKKDTLTKKIYIEKPLGVSYKESVKISNLLNEKGISLHYNEVFLHSSTTDVLVEEITTGRHGKVESIQLNFNGNIPDNVVNQWRGAYETGGMVWYDWGVHSVGLLLGILKRLSIDYLKINPSKMIVTDNVWKNIDSKEVLVHSQVNFDVDEIRIVLTSTWIQKNDFEMRVYLEDGHYFEISIVKVGGISFWQLYEVNPNGSRLLLTQSRYSKERFIRSLTAFIFNRNVDFTDYKLGLKTMEIVDYLFNESLVQKSISL